VTLVHFGPTFDKKIKPWVLPDFTNRVKEGQIAVRWNSRVTAIEQGELAITSSWREDRLKADRVYIMTGFAPSLDLLKASGVAIDPKTGIPEHDSETLETKVAGLFIAGVVVAGTMQTRYSSKTDGIMATESSRGCSDSALRRSQS